MTSLDAARSRWPVEPGDTLASAAYLEFIEAIERGAVDGDNSIEPPKLRSHYTDRGVWTSQTEEWFAQRFAELDTPWTLQPGEPIDLGGQRILIPDFTFRHAGRVAHLDIVGFWRRGYLEQRLQQTPSNVILAVSHKRAGEKKLRATLGEQVIPFAEIIPAKQVLAMVNNVALPKEVPTPSSTETPAEESPADSTQTALF